METIWTQNGQRCGTIYSHETSHLPEEHKVTDMIELSRVIGIEPNIGKSFILSNDFANAE
jgi:hypothetical protein